MNSEESLYDELENLEQILLAGKHKVLASSMVSKHMVVLVKAVWEILDFDDREKPVMQFLLQVIFAEESY